MEERPFLVLAVVKVVILLFRPTCMLVELDTAKFFAFSNVGSVELLIEFLYAKIAEVVVLYDRSNQFWHEIILGWETVNILDAEAETFVVAWHMNLVHLSPQ